MLKHFSNFASQLTTYFTTYISLIKFLLKPTIRRALLWKQTMLSRCLRRVSLVKDIIFPITFKELLINLNVYLKKLFEVVLTISQYFIVLLLLILTFLWLLLLQQDSGVFLLDAITILKSFVARNCNFPDSYRWVSWRFLQYKWYLIYFFKESHWFLVFNWVSGLFLSPIDETFYIEQIRKSFSQINPSSLVYHWYSGVNSIFVFLVKVTLTGVFHQISDLFTASVHWVTSLTPQITSTIRKSFLEVQVKIFYENFNVPTMYSVFTYTGVLFFFNVVFGLVLTSFLGLYGVFITTTISLFMFWVSCVFTTFYLWNQNMNHTIDFGRWFSLHNDLPVHFEFYLDSLSMSFAMLVLTIAFFINIYTFAYFRYEPNTSRLILFIDSFVISMVILVLAANFVVLYFGWEMIGITSFFLINFWSTRVGTLKAAFKAFVFNKISDCFMLIALIIMVSVFSEINILTINEVVVLHTQTNINTLNTSFSATECLGFCLMISAFIKSAQFGFHIWLPDSMEAPVPASALIHSATLVSAGVFLILRFHPIIELTPSIKNCILFFGSLTAFFGGVCSVFQTDVKRLLAYSTISHCGVLMFLTFFKNPDLVIIYLYVHGFFKAAIFMCMGHVIRFANNYQDMRRMGGFYKYLPFEAVMSFISLCNLGGVAFTWGFYMKHFLLIDSSPNSHLNLICFVLVLIGSLSGLIYSYKLYYYVFFDFKKGRKHVYMKLPNNQNKNEYYTNASLASNYAIFFLIFFAYLFCGYLIHLYLNNHQAHFDWTYLGNLKNNLKNFNTTLFLNPYFYINWIIIVVMVFLIFNNWKNKINTSFKLKFFVFSWSFVFFFYVFYTLLVG